VRNTSKKAAQSLAVAAFTLLVSASAFADSRPRNETWRDDDRGRSESSRRDDGRYDDRSVQRYRDNQRVTAEGRISAMHQERDGYRVQLDRHSHSFWVPSSYMRNRGRDFRVGISISVGGVFRNGMIYVDALDWRDGDRYDDRYDDRRYDNRYEDRRYDARAIRGTVERIDYRRDIIVIRDARTGRAIDVNLQRAVGRIDSRDLRYGDFVVISGNWIRGSWFDAHRVETVRSRR
jgi:hypothetical protein